MGVLVIKALLLGVYTVLGHLIFGNSHLFEVTNEATKNMALTIGLYPIKLVSGYLLGGSWDLVTT